jgi:hypothetical protein
MFGLAGLDKQIGNTQGIHEAGAYRLDIEGRTTVDIEPVLQQAGGAGENAIRGGSGDDDQVDVAAGDTGRLDGTTGGLFRQVAGGFVFDDVAFLDAGAIGDPFVTGIDHLFQFGIAQDPGGQVAARSGNA